MNSWSWVGKRIVKVTSHLKPARGAVSGAGGTLGADCDLYRLRVGSRWANLAGAWGSALCQELAQA